MSKFEKKCELSFAKLYKELTDVVNYIKKADENDEKYKLVKAKSEAYTDLFSKYSVPFNFFEKYIYPANEIVKAIEIYAYLFLNKLITGKASLHEVTNTKYFVTDELRNKIIKGLIAEGEILEFISNSEDILSIRYNEGLFLPVYPSTEDQLAGIPPFFISSNSYLSMVHSCMSTGVSHMNMKTWMGNTVEPLDGITSIVSNCITFLLKSIQEDYAIPYRLYLMLKRGCFNFSTGSATEAKNILTSLMDNNIPHVKLRRVEPYEDIEFKIINTTVYAENSEEKNELQYAWTNYNQTDKVISFEEYLLERTINGEHEIWKEEYEFLINYENAKWQYACDETASLMDELFNVEDID